MMQDPLLIEKLRQGDEEAFKGLVDAFQTRVINLAFGFLHDLQEAEDIAQDVFVEVYQSIGKFRGESGITTWIYRITVNKSLNRKKRKSNIRFLSFSREEYTGSQTPREEPEADLNTSPDYRLRNQEDKKMLHQAIDKLPGQQKTAFLLSKYEELTYKQIAEVMQTSVSAIESLLFRAKTNLRHTLTRYMD